MAFTSPRITGFLIRRGRGSMHTVSASGLLKSIADLQEEGGTK